MKSKFFYFLTLLPGIQGLFQSSRAHFNPFLLPDPPALVVLIKSLPEPLFPHLSNGKARRIGELKHGEGQPRRWLTVDTQE